MSKKLELTWVGKDKKISVEPRILIENKKLSNIENDENTENMLIHGDNLLALKALEQKYAGKIKCIYIDPPYNTGAAFEHYDDNLEHSIWLGLMRERLVILRNLLSEDGSIWIQIDDEEQAYLKVLCDEIFGRKNFLNMISVNMKNVAGASGGGEDKRLKKNCEYILIYSKDYESISTFKGAYDYEEIGELVQRYREENISWKYTSILVNSGEKIFVGLTYDGDGNEIRIYKRENFEIKSINKIKNDEKITEKEVYKKYANFIFQTAMPQSSIRPRVMEKIKEIGRESELYSIEYTPKTGRNKGKIYEQFYKGESFRLFAWLRDVSDKIDGELYKKTLQGTYWNFIAGTKNLTKEGNVVFPNGKKPEALISRILEMTTNENDLILDSFLGSGTTCAVAHKMNRRYIGIEMGEHAYTHCKVRLDKVISGEDKGGITKNVNWQGGGAYRFYELAPTLINEDKFGEMVINKKYSPEMLVNAVALHEGYNFNPNKETFWKQSKSTENSYLLVTTKYVDINFLNSIKNDMEDEEYLVIACKNYDKVLEKKYSNIEIKKIPEMLLEKCEFNVENYNLNIINTPIYEKELGSESNE